MIPRRPERGAEQQEWIEHHYAVAKRAVDALKEILRKSQKMDERYAVANDALMDVEASWWQP